jgi:hypothetical protein
VVPPRGGRAALPSTACAVRHGEHFDTDDADAARDLVWPTDDPG